MAADARRLCMAVPRDTGMESLDMPCDNGGLVAVFQPTGKFHRSFGPKQRSSSGPKQRSASRARRGELPMANKKVAIACQGGGTHAAFSWGVLTTILKTKQLWDASPEEGKHVRYLGDQRHPRPVLCALSPRGTAWSPTPPIQTADRSTRRSSAWIISGRHLPQPPRSRSSTIRWSAASCSRKRGECRFRAPTPTTSMAISASSVCR